MLAAGVGMFAAGVGMLAADAAALLAAEFIAETSALEAESLSSEIGLTTLLPLTGDTSSALTLPPQTEQKFNPLADSSPHFSHTYFLGIGAGAVSAAFATGVPQFGQKAAPSRKILLHFEQFIF